MFLPSLALQSIHNSSLKVPSLVLQMFTSSSGHSVWAIASNDHNLGEWDAKIHSMGQILYNLWGNHLQAERYGEGVVKKVDLDSVGPPVLASIVMIPFHHALVQSRELCEVVSTYMLLHHSNEYLAVCIDAI